MIRPPSNLTTKRRTRSIQKSCNRKRGLQLSNISLGMKRRAGEPLKKVNDGRKGEQDAHHQQRQRNDIDSAHGEGSLPPAPFKKSPSQNPNEDSYCCDTGEWPRRFVKV